MSGYDERLMDITELVDDALLWLTNYDTMWRVDLNEEGDNLNFLDRSKDKFGGFHLRHDFKGEYEYSIRRKLFPEWFALWIYNFLWVVIPPIYYCVLFFMDYWQILKENCQRLPKREKK